MHIVAFRYLGLMFKVVSNGMGKSDIPLHQHECLWLSMRSAVVPILKQYDYAGLILM